MRLGRLGWGTLAWSHEVTDVKQDSDGRGLFTAIHSLTITVEVDTRTCGLMGKSRIISCLKVPRGGVICGHKSCLQLGSKMSWEPRIPDASTLTAFSIVVSTSLHVSQYAGLKAASVAHSGAPTWASTWQDILAALEW